MRSVKRASSYRASGFVLREHQPFFYQRSQVAKHGHGFVLEQRHVASSRAQARPLLELLLEQQQRGRRKVVVVVPGE
jgi:hypothetical protein